MMRAARFATFACALLFFAMAGAASAAVSAVEISGFAFKPQSVTITIGDTVTWTNKEALPHSARVAGVGTTPTLSEGQSASLMFMTAGTFNYDCGVHGASMPGTVIVRAAATAPPTPVPTPVRTPVPTARPTVAATAQPTVAQTIAPTASPSPTATAAPTSAVAAPTEQAPAPAAQGGADGLPVLAVVGGVLVLLAIGATLFTRLRR